MLLYLVGFHHHEILKVILASAPRLKNERQKTFWTDDGIRDYQELTIPHLHRLQNLWLCNSSKSSLSLLLTSTNFVLTRCAQLTNKTISLANVKDPKSRPHPKLVRDSARRLLNLHKKLRLLKKDFNNMYHTIVTLYSLWTLFHLLIWHFIYLCVQGRYWHVVIKTITKLVELRRALIKNVL